MGTLLRKYMKVLLETATTPRTDMTETICDENGLVLGDGERRIKKESFARERLEE